MPFDFPNLSGGNIGGHHIPQQREHEATAFAQHNKVALGMFRDSTSQVVPFPDLTQRYHPGMFGTFSYQATPSHAFLKSPLASVRDTVGFNQSINNGLWVDIYNNMVANLPPDMLPRFQYETKQPPPDPRNSSFAALDNTFRGAAQFYAQANAASQPPPIGSETEAMETMNLLFPLMVFQSAIGNGREIAEATINMLSKEGANFPHFDSFTNLINQMNIVLNLMNTINTGLSENTNGQLSVGTRALASEAAVMLSALVVETSRVSLGTDFQVILSTLKSMEVAVTALALPNLAMGSLYIALTTAMIGINTADSPLGLVGNDFSLALAAVSAAIVEGILPENEFAGAQLLNLATTASLLVFTSLTALALDPGFGNLPSTDTKSDAAARFFAFETAAFAANIVITALELTNTGIQINNDIIQLAISKLQSKNDAFVAQIEALITNLKHLVQKLLDSLAGLGDQATAISSGISQIYNQANSTSSSAWAAQQA